MPDVFILNDTPHTLNIALSQVAPLHFENAVAPGETFKTHTGSVWFTVEWRVDNVPASVESSKKAINHSNRYSAAKSAKTIAVVSAAGLSLVALAGPLALNAAAVAGSASAAALLESSAILTAAGSTEAIAFSGYAASTLTSSAIHEIQRSTGSLSEDASESLQKKIDSFSNVIAASSLTGAARSAARGSAGSATRKALISAGTRLVGKIGARTEKDKTKDYGQRAADAGHGPPGKTFRVYGIYIGFKPRRLGIKMKDNVAEMHMDGLKSMTVEEKDEETKSDKDPEMILWDVDKNKHVS